MVSAAELGERLAINPLIAALSAYVRHLESTERRAKRDLAAERVRCERAKAEKLEHENGIRGGRLMDVEAESAQRIEEYRSIRSQFLQLPQKLGRRIAQRFGQAVDQTECTRMINDEVHEILRRIATDENANSRGRNGKAKAQRRTAQTLT
jgi:hypothetical protein